MWITKLHLYTIHVLMWISLLKTVEKESLVFVRFALEVKDTARKWIQID